MNGQGADILIHKLNRLLDFHPPERISRMDYTLTELFGQRRQMRGNNLFDTGGRSKIRQRFDRQARFG